MKVTMYELLGMIKYGKAPKKIKWEDALFVYSECDKDYLEFPFSEEEYKGLFCMKDSILTQYLNDEVEILDDEEKKMPDKILEDEFDKLTKEGKLWKLFYRYNNLIDYLENQRKWE